MPDVEEKNHYIEFGDPACDEFILANYPFYLIDQINHRYGMEMEAVLRKHKMERTQWQILLVLREKTPSSISELSERSGKKLSTVSRAIERMRKDDLVSTSPRGSDNRVTDVFLNATGVQALDKVNELPRSKLTGYRCAVGSNLFEQRLCNANKFAPTHNFAASCEELNPKRLKVASKQYERALDGFSEEEVKQIHHQLQRILGNLYRSPFE